ncbi:hypothetical protein LTR84_009682 [Exophiala bonariae]|uniref:6-phosphogluconolactonase n=1 Tax=Exophiala bonariae TaxID=1690606 RepID=A0AAV9NJZ0_9EURO|nr:hypothetical protein LTR84_009682 [Exophiala bonariae]
MDAEKSRTLYVALQSTGIVELSFQPNVQDAGQALSVISTFSDAGKMPGWLASHQDKIYSISRLHYPDESFESGGLFAFRQSATSSSSEPGKGLSLINEQRSTGKGGVHIDISPDGRVLAAANISGSTVSLFPLSEDGATGEPTFTVSYDGEGPSVNDGKGLANPHEARFDSTGKFLFVPLRSADKLDVYSVNGLDSLTKVQSFELPPKTGPRHSAIQKIDSTTSYLYLLSEKDNTIRVFNLNYSLSEPLDKTTLTINLKQTIPLSKTQPNPHQRFLGAEVAVSDDGKFLYASNRFYPVADFDSDTLSIYRIDTSSKENHLTPIGSSKVLGHSPRMFALSNDAGNQFVAVANAYEQEIIVFDRDAESGFLKEVRGRVKLGEDDVTLRKGPVCVLWT